ncbi:MAG: 50S ribosomal protein L37ae [Candidatus Aenigmatarchaeota archaeon]
MRKSKSFGMRAGKKLRDRFDKAVQHKAFECPKCLKKNLKREAPGIWSCSKCGNKLAGKAYRPK